MKRAATCLALLGLLALSGQAVATICTIDEVPAATLLLPYFQLDLSNPNGLTTLFSINNASANPLSSMTGSSQKMRNAIALSLYIA